MNSSESAPFSPEQLAPTTIVDDLTAECQEYGSVLGYVREIGEFLERIPETHGVLLQLQRHARAIANPHGEEGMSEQLAQAFYWGEIVGYRAGQRVGGGKWAERSYGVLNQSLHRGLRDVQADSRMVVDKPTSGERLQRLADQILGAAELSDESYVPDHLADLIEQWAPDISQNPQLQHYFTFGFRHLVIQITKDMAIEGRKEFFQSKLVESGIEDDDPYTEPITKGIEDFIDIYEDALIETGLTRTSTTEQIVAAQIFVDDALEHALDQHELLSVGDDVVAKGAALYAVFDTTGATTSHELLGPLEKLEGEVVSLTTMDALSSASIPLLKALQNGTLADKNEIILQPLSLVLVLRNAVVMSDRELPLQSRSSSLNKQYRALGPDQFIGLILDNQDMVVSRYE